MRLLPLMPLMLLLALSSGAYVVSPCLSADERIEPRPARSPLLHETFDKAPVGWSVTDASAWQHLPGDGNGVLALVKRKSDYEPPVRSPYNRAILDDICVGDFELNVRLRSTVEDYGHRSLCLFFGYQDESHFYYVHFGKRTDDHANQVFIVNGSPRIKISTKTTAGTPWTDSWHRARIVRDVDSGEIAVYFDDMKTPVMTAVDKTFVAGRIGIGSFDDTGEFDEVVLFGTRADGKTCDLSE